VICPKSILIASHTNVVGQIVSEENAIYGSTGLSWPYGPAMWHYALWGLAGAATNQALAYIEASRKVKGWPWKYPYGPGGGAYLVAVLLQCGVGAIVTWVAAQSGAIHNVLFAFGLGVAAPVAVNKISQYTLAILPRSADDERRGEIDAP
jgi:hypothetical protein